MSGFPQQPKVVVSITPLALRRDSRTFKQAGSVVRLGYRSIVVEGQPSGFTTDGLPFQLLSMSGVNSIERARKERLKVLRISQAELNRQCSAARNIVADHLNCLRHLERNIAEMLPDLVDRDELTELLACVDDFRTRIQRCEAQWQEYGRGEGAEENRYGKYSTASIDDIDRLINECDNSLKQLYGVLDVAAQSRAALIEQVRGWQCDEHMRPGRRVVRFLERLSAPSGRAILQRSLSYRVSSALARAVMRSYKLGVYRRAKLAHWRNSEGAMFLRHLREYILVHVVGPLRCTPKASLYYLHSFYQFPAVYLLCLRHRAKFIYDAHDFYSQMNDHEALSSYWRYWILPFERTIERACICKAAAVVTVNEGIAKLIETRFGRTAIVLRNAHDPRFEKPVDVTIRSIVGIADDKVLIVCVGQFKSGMAVEEAVKAMALLPDRFHLAFVGPGYPSYSELLARENVAGRVHFLPPVQPPQVVPFIRSADAGIVLYYPLSASHQNCLPNGFFQPIAAGLPVIYPELPEMQRIAEQYGLGVPIDPRDPASIAAGVRQLEDQTLMSRLRLNVENSRGKLSWEQDEQQLRELLENLTGLPQTGFHVPLARLQA